MIESALIVQTGFLGDAVLSTALIGALRRTSPETRIGFLVRREYGELFRHDTSIDSLLTIDKKDGDDRRRVRDAIEAEGFHLALLPHRSSATTLMAYRAGIPERVGYRQSGLSPLHTTRVDYRFGAREIDRQIDLLRSLGLHHEPSQTVTRLVPDARLSKRIAESFALPDSPLFAIAPGSVWGSKQWRWEGYAEVVRSLRAEGREVVLIGAPSERELCDRIAARAGLNALRNLAGRLSLGELVALIARCGLLLTNDSGPLHIAEALSVPVTAIFGPTVPAFGFAPYRHGSSLVERLDLPCRPCDIHGRQVCPLGHHRCMAEISAKEVLAHIHARS